MLHYRFEVSKNVLRLVKTCFAVTGGEKKEEKGKTEGLKMYTSTSTVMIRFVNGDLKY